MPAFMKAIRALLVPAVLFACPAAQGAGKTRLSDMTTVANLLKRFADAGTVVEISAGTVRLQGKVVGLSSDIVELEVHSDRFSTASAYVVLAHIDGVVVTGDK